MITRLYIDNYLCFSNFELELNPFTLLLGANGSGKSAILDVIESVRSFVVEGTKVNQFAPFSTLTRWDTRQEQRIALAVALGNFSYHYEVVVQQRGRPNSATVLSETVSEGGAPLFQFEAGSRAVLYDDAHNELSTMSLQGDRSPLGVIQDPSRSSKMYFFREWLANNQLVQPEPHRMLARSDGVADRILPSLRDFADWLRGKYEAGPSRPAAFNEDLKLVLPSFETLSFETLGGDARSLVAKFLLPGDSDNQGQEYSVRFDELSDGQRLLCALYALLNLFFEKGISATLLLDEPENYLALSEIQPWLLRLEEAADEAHQVFMVSHHPEILDQAAVEHGIWLWRDDNGPVRSRPFREIADQSEGTLSASEIVARGWTEK